MRLWNAFTLCDNFSPNIVLFQKYHEAARGLSDIWYDIIWYAIYSFDHDITITLNYVEAAQRQ